MLIRVTTIAESVVHVPDEYRTDPGKARAIAEEYMRGLCYEPADCYVQIATNVVESREDLPPGWADCEPWLAKGLEQDEDAHKTCSDFLHPHEASLSDREGKTA